MAVFTINRTLLPIKAHYVLFWGGLAGIVPFLVTLLQNSNVSATAIGTLYAVLPFVKMISKPLFGGLADKLQQHQTIFLVSKVIMTSALFILYFVPAAPKAGMSSSINISAACNFSNYSCPMDHVSSLARAHGNGHTTYEFALTCVCLVIGWMGMAVAENTGDVIALDLLDEQKRGFGKERVWGSISWGLLAMIAGLLIDHASRGKDIVDFSPGFFMLVSVGILDALVSTRVKVRRASRAKDILKEVGDVFRRPEVIIFTVEVFVVGCMTGVIWTFLIVYLNTLGASQLLIGLTMASQCFLGEIPFFFLADWFLDRIGHANAITLTLAVFAVRFILYFSMENPWTVLAIEVTQGINYGLFFTALATYSSLIAPPGTAATVQGIEQAVFEGFGVGIGCLTAGFLFDTVGGANTFLYFSIFAAICTILSLSVRVWISVAVANTKKRKMPVSCQYADGNVDELQSMT